MSSTSRHKHTSTASVRNDIWSRSDNSSSDDEERRRHNRSRSRSPQREFRQPEKKESKASHNSSLSKVVPLKPNGIKLKLGPSPSGSALNGGDGKREVKKLSVAKAFCDDDSDEEEEMPAECKMRMKNIGRNTPTSSGPNSFGKTKHGFCDQKKLFEKLTKKPGQDD